MKTQDERYWPGPPPPPVKTSFKASDAGCVALILAVLAAFLYPVFASSREPSTRRSCLSNVKQMSLALMMYAQDYDDRMPRAKWMEQTYPYVKNWQVYACPVVIREDAKEFGYGFERTLVGKHTTEVRSPDEQPMVFDSSLLYKNAVSRIQDGLMRPPRHGAWDNVSFLDGHAKSLYETVLTNRWPER